jgi:hypothetical protein
LRTARGIAEDAIATDLIVCVIPMCLNLLLEFGLNGMWLWHRWSLAVDNEISRQPWSMSSLSNMQFYAQRFFLPPIKLSENRKSNGYN